MNVARRLVLSGRVQGVGFRPFVFRLACDMGIAGTVMNGAGRVIIMAEGDADLLDRFVQRLVTDAPPLARPVLSQVEDIARPGLDGFAILASSGDDAPEIFVPADMALCPDCAAELRDPRERRHRYPFTNCTQCGPRYTLIARLPYDRPHTAMAGFPLCADCRREYEDPRDRRFHAEPLACAACGPHLRFVQPGRVAVVGDDAAIAATVDWLRTGGIVAVKGVGGYHLMCDAADNDAVMRLRRRKRRPSKPFAVMFPEEGDDALDAVRRAVAPDPVESAAIRSPERPIVLVARRDGTSLAEALAPGLNELGVFLPYAPLHVLLLDGFGGPLVATSANISGEPVITDNAMAEARLGSIADAFLHHDRPILRPADDSVVRVIAGVPRAIRVGRGMAPLELALPLPLAAPTVATGAEMKNAVALGFGSRAVLSPHIGELDTPRARDVFAATIVDMQTLYSVDAARAAADSHPGYFGNRWVRGQRENAGFVPHHHAHASALAGENPDIGSWLVFTWDGVGLGPDGTLWGGEALLGRPGAWRRVASLRPLLLPGASRAGREPWRSAAAMMWAGGHDFDAPNDASGIARKAWSAGANCHETSAAGRVFDGAAALVFGLDAVSFEGEAPMRLEAIADMAAGPIELPLARGDDGIWRSDWAPLLPILSDRSLGIEKRAGAFHATMAAVIATQVRAVVAEHPFDAVGLTGGVFQNRKLAEAAIRNLAALDIAAHLPQTVPANDGGIAYGQLVELAARDQRNPT